MSSFISVARGLAADVLWLFGVLRKKNDSAQKQLITEPVYDYFCYVTTERLTPWLTGGKQLRLNVPNQHLHAAPWEAWLKLSSI